jgi:transcription elongation factor Elf1
LRVATFSAADPPSRIREDLACPACGHQDLDVPDDQIAENALRFFCDCCGAFITIELSDEQAAAIRAWGFTSA